MPGTIELRLQRPGCQLSDGAIEVVAPRSSNFMYSLDGIDFQNNPLFNGLMAGVYSVFVMNQYGCISVEWVVLNALHGAPDNPQVEVIEPICSYPYGTLKIIEATSGYLYKIGEGPFEPYPPNGYENLTPGTYLLTVKNSEGCVSSIQVLIPDPEVILVKVEVFSESCFGAADGAIDLQLLSGRNVQFNWSGPEQFSATTASIAGISGGNYRLTVTNNDGCFLSVDYSVQGPLTPLSLEVALVHPTVCDATDGAINLSVSGGVKPYSFALTNSNGAMISSDKSTGSLMAGHYILEVTDAVGCIIQQNILLDFAAPTECLNFTAYVDAWGRYEVKGIDLLVPMPDDCKFNDYFSILVDPPVLYCSEEMAVYPVNVKMISRLGTIHQCTAMVELLDTIPPVVACRDTILYLDERGIAYLDNPPQNLAVYDNCGVSSIILSRSQFDCNDIGIHSISMAIKDSHGNSAYCNFLVTIADTLAPVLVVKDVNLWFTTADTLWLADALEEDLASDNCAVYSDALFKQFFTCIDVGEHIVTREITDLAGNSAIDSFLVVVRAGLPPAAESDTFRVVSGISDWLDILDNDHGYAGDLKDKYVVVTKPSRHGLAAFDTNLFLLSYLSDGGFTGTDSIHYALCSNGGVCGPVCDTALVVIYVMPYNFKPVATNDRYDLGNCRQFEANVLHNDSDPGSDIGLGEVELIKAPGHGTLQIFSDGYFFYTPPVNFVGIDNFVYRVCDSGFPALCDSAIVQLHILADANCDGIPDAFAIGLFIPEGFSPNDDGIGDQFRILGLGDYPDARLWVYDRWGSLVFDKSHYGNLAVWATDEAAWWSGTYESSSDQNGRVARGNYLYVLDLGNRTIHRGIVTVAY